MRRLPVYFLVDIYELMVGNPIEQVQDEIATIVKKLRTDLYTLETVYVSIIVFAGKSKRLTLLSEPIQVYYPPKLPIGSSTSLGKAFKFSMNDLDSSVQKTTIEQKGDWKPIIFLFTDGNPIDEYQGAFDRWKQKFWRDANLIVISIGDNTNINIFGKIIEKALILSKIDIKSFKQFFKWVTASIETNSINVSERNSDELQLSLIKENTLFKIDFSKYLSAKIDKYFAVILAKIKTTQKCYSFNYQLNKIPSFELSEWQTQAFDKINTSELYGFSTCLRCGNQFRLSTCSCIAVTRKVNKPAFSCVQQTEHGLSDGNLNVVRTRR